MKVKVISRNPDDYMRETKHDIHRLKRNYDPSLHPLEGPRKLLIAKSNLVLFSDSDLNSVFFFFWFVCR